MAGGLPSPSSPSSRLAQVQPCHGLEEPCFGGWGERVPVRADRSENAADGFELFHTNSKTTQRNKQIAMGRKKFNMDPKKVSETSLAHGS